MGEQIDKMRNQMLQSDRKLQRLKNYSARTERLTLLGAGQAANDRLHSRWDALQEQWENASRVLHDLEVAHEALEEDHHIKTIAMKYTHKCLLVAAKEEDDPKTRDNRIKVRERCMDHRGWAEITKATLQELRAKIRALASTSSGVDLDGYFGGLLYNHKLGDEITDKDLRLILRKDMKVSPKVISDEQIASLCAILDDDGSGSVNVQEFKDFIDQEQNMAKIESFNVATHSSHGGARKKRIQEESETRPPLDTLPFLKPSQMVQLKKRIRGAALIAARDQALDVGGGSELEALFGQFDKDGGGELEDFEVRRAFRVGLKIPKTQLSDAELWTLIHTIDADGSGSIAVKEFVEWVNS